MNGRQIDEPVEAQPTSGASRRRILAGILGGAVAALDEHGETAAVRRRSRRRDCRRREGSRGEWDDLGWIASGVTATGASLALRLPRGTLRDRFTPLFAFLIEDLPQEGVTLLARGTVLLPEGRPLEFAGPLDLNRSVGSCERLRLEIGPLDLAAPGEPVQIALLLPAIQAAREAARRLLCEFAGLLALGRPSQELASHLNALMVLPSCRGGNR